MPKIFYLTWDITHINQNPPSEKCSNAEKLKLLYQSAYSHPSSVETYIIEKQKENFAVEKMNHWSFIDLIWDRLDCWDTEALQRLLTMELESNKSLVEVNKETEMTTFPQGTIFTRCPWEMIITLVNWWGSKYKIEAILVILV